MAISRKRRMTDAERAEERKRLASRIKAMKDAEYSTFAISLAFKISESSVRALLKESE